MTPGVAARWALCVAVALLGCDPSDPSPSEGAESGCVDDDGCPAGTRCATGACVGDSPPSYAVALRLRPRADRVLAPVQLEGIDFAPTEPVLSLLNPLPLPDRVELTVRVAGADGRSLPARAIARANRGIGPPSLIGAEPLNDPVAPGVLLPLAPWWPTPIGGARQINYTLRIEPEGLPPWRVDVLQVDRQQTSQRFSLPGALADLPAVRGRVLVSLDNPTPLAGLRVEALDEAGRLISTIGETDASGAFDLRLWPEQVARAITLRTLSPDEARPLPIVRQAITVPAGGSPPDTTLYLGDVGRAFTVTGQLGDPEAPVAGATVHLTATVGNGEFSTTTFADDDGTFEVAVYPSDGEYIIDIEPPLDPERPFRLTRRAARLTPDGAPLVIEPLGRSQVFGRVVDVAGRPTASATVSATLQEARYGDPRLIQPGETPPSRTVITTTAADGTFAFALDPGRHTLEVRPPVRSGLPATTHTVTFSGEQGRPADVGTLVVPAAAVLSLTLVDERAAPVADVAVEAWRADGDPPTRLGDARSDAEGRVVLVLPATLADDGTTAPDAGAP